METADKEAERCVCVCGGGCIRERWKGPTYVCVCAADAELTGVCEQRSICERILVGRQPVGRFLPWSHDPA